MGALVWHDIYWLIRADMSRLPGFVDGNKSAVLNILFIADAELRSVPCLKANEKNNHESVSLSKAR